MTPTDHRARRDDEMTRPRAASLAGLLLAALLTTTAVWAQQQGPLVEVPMKNLAYEPKTITVPAGTTVVWTNLDAYPNQHTVTADDNTFASPLLDEGQTFSVTFDTPGTYPYYCVPHGYPGGFGMAGVVVVQ